MTTAIGYTRHSDDSDVSVGRQKRRIEDYCERVGLELDDILDDGTYSSGFDPSREEYQRVRARMREGDIDAIVLNDRSRIGRDFDERMRFVLDVREMGIALHTTQDGAIDLTNPFDVVMEGFHAASDDESKRGEIERSKQAIEERQENGCYQGTPPLGLEFAEDGCHLQKSDRWDDVMDAIGQLESGVKLKEIEAKTGIGKSTLSRIRYRGKSWYEDKLETFCKPSERRA